MDNKFFFSITKKQGFKYSIESGDKNKIHTDSNYGYNSIFGKNICHGTFVILCFLKKIKFNYNDKFYIEFIFKYPFFYNDKIFIKKKQNKQNTTYYLIQNNKEKAEIIFNFSKDFSDQIKKIKSKKKFVKKITHRSHNIKTILNTLSMYVGTIYPGENSLISKIKIFHNLNKKIDNRHDNYITICSKIFSKGFPIINNYLEFNTYEVNFESLIRPNIRNSISKTPKYLKKIVNKINHNILIIGGSQGIGKYFFDIFKSNKKITKIVTYNKNILKDKSKKTVIKKLNVLKDTKNIDKLISKYSPLKIYYFPTNKIYFENTLNKKIINEYNKIYIDIPLDILKKNKDKNISFFYPSTTNIELNKNSVYSKIKISAEKKIKKFCNKFNIKHYIYRFPAIHSKQSVSLLNSNPPNLIKYINMNKEIIKILF